MANENVINTRIGLKIDTLANWQSNNPVLLPGEVAFVQIGEVTTDSNGKRVIPPVMFKVGPGNFNDLGWGAAKAADVYEWAKLVGENVFTKDGNGNVISGIAYDATLNNGKGGFKYTTASVATSEGLKDVNDRLAAVEKNIDDNEETWALDTDTQYTFAIEDKKLKVNKTLYTNGVPGQPVEVGSYDIIDDIVINDPEFREDPGSGDTALYQLPITSISWDDTKNELTINRGVISANDVIVDYTGDGSNGRGTVKDLISEHSIAINDRVTYSELNETIGNLESDFDTKLELLPDVEGGQGIQVSAPGSGNAWIVSENFEFNDKLTADNKLQILDSTSKEVIAEFDASEFVKDSYLDKVSYDAETNILTFTFIDNEDNLTDIPVDLTDLVDIYKADEVTLTEENTESGIKFSIKDKGVTEDKLADAVTEKLNKQWQPIGDYKVKQTAVEDKGLTGAKVLASLSQNVNGEIAYETRSLTPADIGAQPAGNYKTTQEAKNFDGTTIQTVTNVSQNENGEVEVTYGNIAFPEIPVGSGDVAIATVENDIVTLNGSVQLDGHILTDGAAADITLAKIAKTGSIYDIGEGSNQGDVKYLVFNCGTASTVI